MDKSAALYTGKTMKAIFQALQTPDSPLHQLKFRHQTYKSDGL